MTAAFTIFAKKMTREKRIPFDVAVDPFYSESNMTYLKKVIDDIESGKAVLVEHNRYEGIGKPEPLKENYSGWWSRRIDEENRIVYKEREGSIVIASCKGHYED